LKSQGPRAFASNSTVMMRLVSICVLEGLVPRTLSCTSRSETESTLMPSAVQIAR
jgi:hypothetical protein